MGGPIWWWVGTSHSRRRTLPAAVARMAPSRLNVTL